MIKNLSCKPVNFPNSKIDKNNYLKDGENFISDYQWQKVDQETSIRKQKVQLRGTFYDFRDGQFILSQRLNYTGKIVNHLLNFFHLLKTIEIKLMCKRNGFS